MRISSRSVLMIIVQAFLLVVVGVASVGRARRNLGPEEWRQDLKFLASELPRKHKNLFFQLSKNEFERQVRELDESIPTLTEIENPIGFRPAGGIRR
jgi:hypothetical protein